MPIPTFSRLLVSIVICHATRVVHDGKGVTFFKEIGTGRDFSLCKNHCVLLQSAAHAKTAPWRRVRVPQNMCNILQIQCRPLSCEHPLFRGPVFFVVLGRDLGNLDSAASGIARRCGVMAHGD
jgi:hypothetical protein